MADNVKNWTPWDLDKLYWGPEVPNPQLAIKQGNEWVLAVTDWVWKASVGILNGNWTSNILPAWLILEPRKIEEIISNIYIIYEEEYSDNLISTVKSTYKQLNMYFNAARWTMFDYFEENKNFLKMLSEIYNDKYKEVFIKPSSGINICSDLEYILQPNYFENQEKSRIDSDNRRALRRELELLVWLNEVLWEYLNNPNMLYELCSKMEEDWKLTDRESEFISNRLNSGWILMDNEALFYMLCIEFRLNEVTRRVKEWKMSSDEQKKIMKVNPEKAVKILYDIIKSEETNS